MAGKIAGNSTVFLARVVFPAVYAWGKERGKRECLSVLEQINFEMLHISKFSFSRKMRFSAESTPHCGALHFRAALEHLHFFKVKML
ncbi:MULTISPECIES: hypothetical protein [unclassified Desulfovibrio]|uniref:hypothetical protein n=1 Tax=unclassified Desulfovibrio TaxID=2593640 RepID=UPI002FD8859A